MIGERTRAALAAYKARGGSLGASRPECRNLTDEGRRRGCEAAARARRDEADAAYADLIPTMRRWRAEGRGQAEIADRLHALGHTTRRGCRWNQGQVSRVLARAKA